MTLAKSPVGTAPITIATRADQSVTYIVCRCKSGILSSHVQNHLGSKFHRLLVGTFL